MHNTLGLRYHRLAYVYASAVAVMMGTLLLGIPVQLSDSFTEFTAMHGRGLWEVISAEFYNGAYFRPFRRALIKIVYDLSGGHYYIAFRGFQALELLLLLVLVVRMLRVRTAAALAAVPLGLAVLVGMHTFAGAVREGLPINHFLTILICCAGAVNLAQAKRTWLVDAAAVALLVAAMMTIESGLLVWAIFAAAYIVGYRGVSRGALIALTACVAIYFAGRFVIIGGAAPGLNERSAGFGFAVLNPDELVRRFGSNPLPFYAYNIVSAVACVLFAEPRGGVWMFVREVATGRPEPWQIVNVITSVLTTAVMLRFAASRIPKWKARDFDDADRFIIIFLVVLPLNALFAAAYEKDVIMSPAGLFYAVAAYFAFRELLSGSAVAIAPAVVLLIAIGWSIRFVGMQDNLRARALSVQDEWAYYDDWAREQPTDVHLTAEEEVIRQHLYDDAVLRAPRVPQLSLGGIERLFDFTQ
ncbi:MAG TPA: hypothetical protein VL693_08770 [Vicinamibacterales bacterium]|nr:hypothetical protein [Vicinamibacterales bacterium]